MVPGWDDYNQTLIKIPPEYLLPKPNTIRRAVVETRAAGMPALPKVR
jgi:hypothetical protein